MSQSPCLKLKDPKLNKKKGEIQLYQQIESHFYFHPLFQNYQER